MPAVQLNDAELTALSAFVQKLTPDNEGAIMAAPDYVVQGALVYQSNHCDSCHQIKGVGKTLGPPLDGVGDRHDRAWLEQHFRDPQAVSKGTIMPPYKFNDTDMDAHLQVPAPDSEGLDWSAYWRQLATSASFGAMLRM